MNNEILYNIGQLFITFLSAGASIATMFYLSCWVVTFILSIVFPSRYGLD